MIVNSSPLIILSKLNKLDLLKVFNKVEITQSVYEEVVIAGIKKNDSGAFLIKEAIDKKEIKIKKLNRKFEEKAQFLRKINKQLHYGEAETIALALQEKQKEVLIDEKLARSIAELQGLKVRGSLRVLLLAFEKNLITKTEIKKLLSDMILSDFRISADILDEFWTLFARMKKK